MSDNITLPREVVEQLLKMLEMVEPYADQFTDYSSTAAECPLNLLPEKVGVAITALRTALAAPPASTQAAKSLITAPKPMLGLISNEVRAALKAADAVESQEAYLTRTPALAAKPTKKTPAWWMDGLAATLMREGVNKHRAREIAAAYWDAYCQIPGNEEEPT